MTSKTLLVCQKWEESERGWGVRPDGFSLHVDQTELSRYLREYTKDRTGPAPDEYDRPCGKPYLCVVDDETFERIQEKKSERSFSNIYPSPALKGDDQTGWVTMKESR